MIILEIVAGLAVLATVISFLQERSEISLIPRAAEPPIFFDPQISLDNKIRSVVDCLRRHEDTKE